MTSVVIWGQNHYNCYFIVTMINKGMLFQRPLIHLFVKPKLFVKMMKAKLFSIECHLLIFLILLNCTQWI